MYSPYRVQAISPPRSTPSLEPDSLDHEYLSPADDDYLTTPDLTEWREIQRLEYEKERLLAVDEQGDVQNVSSFRRFYPSECDRIYVFLFSDSTCQHWSSATRVQSSPNSPPIFLLGRTPPSPPRTPFLITQWFGNTSRNRPAHHLPFQTARFPKPMMTSRFVRISAPR